MNTSEVAAVLAELANVDKNVLCAEAIDSARIMGMWEVEADLRIEVLRNLESRGLAGDDAPKLMRTLQEGQREAKLTRVGIIEKELERVMARLGIDALDKKARYQLRKRIERDKRKKNGECIDCPSAKVEPALPGETRCAQCKKKHGDRSRSYRTKKGARARRAAARDTRKSTTRSEEHVREAREPNVGGEHSVSGARNAGTEVGVAAHDSESGAISHNNGGAQDTLPVPFFRRSASNERKP